MLSLDRSASKGLYSVSAHRRVISTEQAALIMMCDWPEALLLLGYSGKKDPSDVQRRCA